MKLVFKTYKVKLHPNNVQNTRMKNTGFTCIALYNCLCKVFSMKDKNDKIMFKYPNVFELRKTFTIVKEHLIGNTRNELNDYGQEMLRILTKYFENRKHNIYNIYNISNDSLKQTIKDFNKAMVSFFNKKARFPKFKKSTFSNLSFYVDPIKISFTSSHVKLEKLTDDLKRNRQIKNFVKLAEKNRIPTGVKYYNPRVTYDGVNWWISVSVYVEDVDVKTKPKSKVDVLGIDLGIKQTYLSNNTSYPSINRSPKVRKINKRLKRLQRALSRKYRINNKKTRNYIKTLIKIRKLQSKLTNLRHDHQDRIINDIRKLNPKRIAIEDLSIKKMMKNKHLSRRIAQEEFYRFRLKITEYCKNNNVILTVVPNNFPSSKMCSCCHRIKKDLKLTDRIYKCECGLELDRDYNAALNIAAFKNK